MHCVRIYYLLSCMPCGMQDVGERAVKVNLRMNFHRPGKSGCEIPIPINHIKILCRSSTFTF